MTATPEDMRPRPGRAIPAIAAAGLATFAAFGFGLYAFLHQPGKPVANTGACAKSLDAARSIEGLVRGEIAALVPARAPRDLGAIAFDDADGHKTTVGASAGRTILLNLWATWCVPCRQEMPSLDRLQAQSGSKIFGVLPVDVDQQRLDKARGFFKEIGVTNLPYYADNSADILRALGAQGLPTTVLIGGDGCEIATLAGPAEWDSPEAKAVIAKVAPAQS